MSDQTRKFLITGMSCAACSARVEKAVSAVSGVESCTVNLLSNSMSVTGSATNEAIIHAVEKAGFHLKKQILDDIEKYFNINVYSNQA